MSTITRFYEAFIRRDHQVMGACYHDEATFHDPVFGTLNAEQARAMWRMLLSSSMDLRITYQVLNSTEDGGTAQWDAYYTFSRTGRPVHNSIKATFTFKDGLILTHHDHFDLWRWSRQALGLSGFLLGWSPIVANKVRGTARRALDRSMAEHTP